MLQIILTLVIFVLLIIPIGRYMFHIATGQHTFCDPVFNRIDNGIYRICGINQNEGMGWKKYALALVLTNAVMVFIGYLILRIQFLPVFNPNGIGAMEPTLSFNTIISFMTNTNLQHYSGESGLSYLSQMLVIIFMMFVSASTGYAACVAFCRGLTGTSKNNLGNFYVDLVRITTRILIPFSIIVTLILVWQGAPQNFMANQTVTTIEGTKQDIAMGPIASLVSIKHLGTNGGGFLGANSTTPLENPTIISDISSLVMEATSTVPMYFPRRSTEHLSATALISSSLWVMKRMDLPSATRLLMISMSSSISWGVRTAVGSSNIMISLSR